MPKRFHPPGRLRFNVTLQSPVQSDDTGGGGALTWTTLATVAANVLPINGREVAAADGLQARVNTLIVIRWRGGIDSTCRAVFRGRALNIRSAIDVDSRREWLELLCESGAET